jgi:isopenicillin N synthase-like dioxygenase
MHEPIPLIDVGPLFAPAAPRRDRLDREILSAAAAPGFIMIGGTPPQLPIGPDTRADLLRIFALPAAELHALWRQKFEPANPNVYRGFFPLQPGNLTSKEGIDLGADVAYGPAICRGDDPLREPTPLPARAALPGWHEAVAAYYLGMEQVCGALMRSLARGLGLEERFFDAAFERGLSTLRLLRYPLRGDLARLAGVGDAVWRAPGGQLRYLMGAPHVDSGFLTVVAQDRVAGLEARHRDGSWIPVPPREGAFAVNFGRVLERWSRGRIHATEHRVVGAGEERFSVAYFHEARADAEIGPLPIDPADSFEPFCFGDFLWSTITQFVEFRGMEGLRRTGRAR